MIDERYYYHAKEFIPGHYHIITPSGSLVYDDNPHGKDKPLVFRDEDKAIEFARRCNQQAEDGE